MGVQQSSLSSITTRYNVKFREGYTSMTQSMNWMQFAEETTSTGSEEIYPIKARPSKAREWVGERLIREQEVYGYALKNKKYEATTAVKVDDMEDDKYGLYDNQMADMGEAAARLPWDELVAAIKAGGSSLCWDGQYFFDSDHPLDIFGSVATTYANLVTSTSLTHANVSVVRTSMATQVDHHGSVLGITPTHIFVPEALRSTGETICKMPLVILPAGGTVTDRASAANVLQNRLQLVVIPDLDSDSATTWYMADLSKRVKPFFWQWRKRPLFQRLTDENSQHVMTKDEYVFGFKCRGRSGYTLPQLMFKCTA